MELRRLPASSRPLEDTLDVAAEILARDPRCRLYSWEAEFDLYKVQHPGDVQVAYTG